MKIGKSELVLACQTRQDWHVGPHHPTLEEGFYVVWITAPIRTMVLSRICFKVWDAVLSGKWLHRIFLNRCFDSALDWVENRMELVALVPEENQEYLRVSEEWAREHFRWSDQMWSMHDYDEDDDHDDLDALLEESHE